MKKTLILASVLAMTMTGCFAAENAAQNPVETKAKINCEKPQFEHKKPPMNEEMAKKKAQFEKRLKLTDEQKAKAKELREESFEKMKPIMEDIRAKHQEIAKIRKSDIDEDAKREQIRPIRKELRTLDRQVNEIRRQNMKDFESLLTEKQLKELEKIKKEGRKEFEKNHKKPPMMHGIKPFEHGPMFPPPPKAYEK